MISRIIKVEVGVISWSRRLRLITLTETLITLDITKTESNNCFIIHWTKNKNKKKWKSSFCFFTDGKQHKARELDMITLRNYAPRSYMTWLPVTLRHKREWVQCIYCVIADFAKSLFLLGKLKILTVSKSTSLFLYLPICLFCFVSFVCLESFNFSFRQLKKAGEDLQKEKYKIPKSGFKPGLS